MVFVLIGVSAHPLWIGLMLAYIFGFRLEVTPIGGYCAVFTPSETCGGPVQWAYHLLLPWIAFGAVFAAIYARMIRASVLEVYDADHVRTARAIGMSEGRILRTQVLRNALLPLVTMLGMDLGIAFGGAIFVERAFGLPGIGKLLISSLGGRDLPVILGIVVLVTTAILFFNLLVDLLYPFLDPRIGYGVPEPVREGALEVAARAGADDGRPGLAAFEQDHRRQREDAVARRYADVLVDVQPHEAEPVLGGERLQDRLDRLARLAPRRPEVDDRHAAGADDLLLERRVGDLSHKLPLSAARRSSGTFQIASSTIERDIFEPPDLAVDEADRDLAHAKAAAQRAIGQLDLEGVALGVDRVQVDRLEHRAAEALEAAGEVADGDAEQQPRIERAAGGDGAAHGAPVLDAAAGHVARAQHEVRVAGRGSSRRGTSAGSWEKSQSISTTSSAPSSSARRKPAR